MKVLDYNAGKNYTDYLVKSGIESLADIDNRMMNINDIKSWEKERKNLITAYKAAYPAYMFQERSPVKSELVIKRIWKMSLKFPNQRKFLLKKHT